MRESKESGIDINLGDKCSKNAYQWAKKTFINRKNKSGTPCLSMDGAFSNMLDFNGVKIGISSDGIGTKIEVAERMSIYDTLGYDLIAMVIDDLITTGFEPTNISNIIDVDYMNYDIIDSLMKGLCDAANCSKIAITGGEIAELGDRINGYGDKMHFNWTATGIGILHKNLKKAIDGSEIKIGDIIISLKSRAFRSNGFSLIRKVMSEKFGDKWHNVKFNGKSWGEILLGPSIIYSPVICKLLDMNFSIKGITHITGGGIVGNLKRILKINNVGAELDNLFEAFDFMEELRLIANISYEKAYNYWNMGNGMLIVVDKDMANKILSEINKSDYIAKISGRIVNKGIKLRTGNLELNFH